jgi:hypothetical protein
MGNDTISFQKAARNGRDSMISINKNRKYHSRHITCLEFIQEAHFFPINQTN